MIIERYIKGIYFVYGRTAVEVKDKDTLDERDLRPLANSKFRKKILISKTPVTQKGVENITLVDYLL